MILNEQRHSNLNRSYYHGKIFSFENDKRKFSEFYLSTSLLYSLVYAYDEDHNFGVIEEYRLKSPINIFNAKDKKDEACLRIYLHKNVPKYLKYIELLKENDWSVILEGDYNRQILIDIIKDLGYDGYFNYEIDKESIDFLHKAGVFKYSDLTIKQPSICIFNKDSIKKVFEWDKKSLLRNSKFNDIKNKEIEWFSYKVRNKMLETKDEFDEEFFIEGMYRLTLTLDKNELYDIIDEVQSNLDSFLKRKRESLLRFQGTYNGFSVNKKPLLEEIDKDLNWIRMRKTNSL